MMKFEKYEHFLEIYKEFVSLCGDNLFLKSYEKESIHDISWKEGYVFSCSLAHSLKFLLNVAPSECVGIWGLNTWKWVISDLAIQFVGATSVPIHSVTCDDHLLYILQETEMKVIFVQNDEYAHRLEKMIDGKLNIKIIPLFSKDKSLFDEFISQKVSHFDFILNDIFGIIYTSGTTGEPKGVVLKQKQLLAQIKAHSTMVPGLAFQNVSFSILPLSHVFERGWLYFNMAHGMSNCFGPSGPEVVSYFSVAHPHTICVVPRVLEKIYQKVHGEVQKKGFIFQKIFYSMLHIASQNARQKGHLSLDCTVSSPVAKWIQKKMLQKVRALFGERLQTLICGGAKLSVEVEAFFAACGVRIMQGYGITESTGTVCCYRFPGATLGNVGVPVEGVSLRLSQEGEVQIKGDSIFTEYYKKPQETKEAFTEDGYFKTQDVGTFDSLGNLCITDRLKDLIKTSHGKFVAPQRLETQLGQDTFIEQIAVIGDAKSFVSALIVPAFHRLEEYAREKGIAFENRMDLIQHIEIIKFYRARIDKALANFAKFEQIPAFTLLSDFFTVEGGELTPTLKIRRQYVMKKYQSLILKMYQEIA